MNPCKTLFFLVVAISFHAGCSFDTASFDGLTCEEGVDKIEATRVCRNGVWETRNPPAMLDQGGLPDMAKSGDMKVTPADMARDMRLPGEDVGIDMAVDMRIDMGVDMCTKLNEGGKRELAAATACGMEVDACGEQVTGVACSDGTYCDGKMCKSCEEKCELENKECGAVQCNGAPYNCKSNNRDTAIEDIDCDGDQLCGSQSPEKPQICLPEVILEAPDDEIGFGDAIDLDGEFLAIGAPRDRAGSRTDNGAQGSVFVYRRNKETLAWEKMDVPKTPGNAKAFGAAVAIDAKTKQLFVGAPDSEDGKGAVYLYEIDSQDKWAARGLIMPGDYVVNGQSRNPRAYGHALAFSDRMLVVGAPTSEGRERGQKNGMVLVYDRPGTFQGNNFNTPKKLTVSRRDKDAYMGWAVAIKDDLIVASAPREEPKGKVYLYDTSNLDTAKKVMTTNFTHQSILWFGYAVAISLIPNENTALIYASMPTYYDGTSNQIDLGTVEVFSYEAANDVLRADQGRAPKISDMSPLVDMYHGYDVDVDGDLSAVGAPGRFVTSALGEDPSVNPSSYVVSRRYVDQSSPSVFYRPSFASTHFVGHRVDVSQGVIAISAPTRDKDRDKDRVVLIRR